MGRPTKRKTRKAKALFEAGLKQCISCGIVKPITHFHKDCNGRDGLKSSCVECRKSHRAALYEDLDSLVKYMLVSVRARAKRKNMLYALSEEWLHEELRASNFACPLVGKPFEFTVGSPWMASVDRIDSAKGYTEDNSRVICVMANLARNANFSDEDVVEFCRAGTQHADKMKR